MISLKIPFLLLHSLTLCMISIIFLEVCKCPIYKLDSYLDEHNGVAEATWLKKWGVDTKVASSALSVIQNCRCT